MGPKRSLKCTVEMNDAITRWSLMLNLPINHKICTKVAATVRLTLIGEHRSDLNIETLL